MDKSIINHYFNLLEKAVDELENKPTSFKIVARSSYGTEIVDEFKSLDEALSMKVEYKLAFGPSFSVSVRYLDPDTCHYVYL